MCGILASIAKNLPDLETSHAFGERLALLKHRGPDGQGVCGVATGYRYARLGMTRLAIVGGRDLVVPFWFEGAPHMHLAFNGEIYNWRALRHELQMLDRRFTHVSDAEVLIHAVDHWGIDQALRRLNGMFAFVLIDTKRDQFYAARDRAGEKPLYMMRDGDVLHFASEIKALPGLEPRLQESMPFEIQALEFDCLKSTPFERVERVLPGHLVMHPSGVQNCWWRYENCFASETQAPQPPSSYSDAKDELVNLLTDSIVLRTDCVRPTAVMLSGGLDSAIIQAVAESENLYTVSFPEVNNLEMAQRAAKAAAPVNIVTFDLKALEHALPEVVYHLDTPATWTAVCQWFLFKRMREDGMVVALSGEGADELFLGYSRYKVLYWLHRMQIDEELETYAPLVQLLLGGDEEHVLAKLLDRSGLPLPSKPARELTRVGDEFTSLPESMALIDWRTTMQCLLRMADKMAGAWGMENRSPFLDHRLIEFSATIPLEWKITDAHTKSILRDAAVALGVPESVALNPHKRGLVIPWVQWMKNLKLARPAESIRDRSAFSSLMWGAWWKRFGFSS